MFDFDKGYTYWRKVLRYQRSIQISSTVQERRGPNPETLHRKLKIYPMLLVLFNSKTTGVANGSWSAKTLNLSCFIGVHQMFSGMCFARSLVFCGVFLDLVLFFLPQLMIFEYSLGILKHFFSRCTPCRNRTSQH
jgi:vacuolar-type H+-ATPase subunit I/STV1